MQSPFSDVYCLHMTLTNKGFQNVCWSLEDMVCIQGDMVRRLLVAVVQRSSPIPRPRIRKAPSAHNMS